LPLTARSAVSFLAATGHGRFSPGSCTHRWIWPAPGFVLAPEGVPRRSVLRALGSCAGQSRDFSFSLAASVPLSVLYRSSVLRGSSERARKSAP
jgi:hypothetical protein